LLACGQMICFAQKPVLEEAMKDLIKQYLDQGISRRCLGR
jgi:hypothetical protein